MPKTLPERIFFTIVMAAIMVYGMIVYNVALNTNGVTNATFVMALHEMPIMVPVAFVLEFFVVEKLATKLALVLQRVRQRRLSPASRRLPARSRRTCCWALLWQKVPQFSASSLHC